MNLTPESWAALTPEEQVDRWLAVPANQSATFIAAARPAARAIFTALPALPLNGDIASGRVVLKKALQQGNWIEHASELSRLTNDDERLSRFVEQLTWQRRAAEAWQSNLQPVLLDEFPAYELRATSGRIKPGTKDRWQQCGGRLFSGKMIAVKTDSVWARFSEFGKPFPPYDNFGHRLDVQDIDRDTAFRLRLVSHR